MHTCKLCGRENTAKDPERYPYCRDCHYTGVAEEDRRADQLDRFRAAMPDAKVVIEHTGGGCLWLSFYMPDEADTAFYVATDGEAYLPCESEEPYTPLPEGGWKYVGRHTTSEDETHPDYEGTPLVYFNPEDAQTLSDEQVVETIRADLASSDWWVVTETPSDPMTTARWRGKATDALEALDRFAVGAGFVPYSDLPKDDPGTEWVGEPEADGRRWAIFTNTTLWALPVEVSK